MDQIYIYVGLSVILVFLFRKELLIEDDSFSLILGLSIVLFIAGVALHFTEAGRYSTSGALLSPLPSVLLFRLLRKWFIKLFDREPRDAAFRWETGLGWDRAFGFIYFILVAGLVILTSMGMKALAEAGW